MSGGQTLAATTAEEIDMAMQIGGDETDAVTEQQSECFPKLHPIGPVAINSQLSF
jgi:hypothetical protein